MPVLPRLEKDDQAAVVELLQRLGGVVFVLGTVRPAGDHMGTRQTRGVPDLYAFVKHRPTHAWHAVWFEMKAPGGRLRPEQHDFREQCLAAGVPHVVGDVDAVLAWLREHGYLQQERNRTS